MLIDRDVRFSLLSTIQILQFSDDWLSVQDVIDCLEKRMLRRYDRRSIYANFNTLEQFGMIETKHIRHNTKIARWINGEAKRWDFVNASNVRVV